MRRHDDEARVLAALTDDWTPHLLVRHLAAMDQSRCGYALQRLVADGVIEKQIVKRGIGHGSGRPKYLYRRRTEAAA